MSNTNGQDSKARSSRRLLLPLLALALAASGCATDEDTSIAQSSHELTRVAYDGATLAQGLFFGVGPVAKALPGLWSQRVQPKLSPRQAADTFRGFVGKLGLNPEEEAQAKRAEQLLASGTSGPSETAAKVADLILARVAKRDPSTLKRFAEEMQSGDPTRVGAAVVDIGREFRAVTQFDHPFDTHSGWWLNNDAAVNINTFFNLNVAVNVDHVYNVTHMWSLEQNPAADLRNELLIAQITEQLAV